MVYERLNMLHGVQMADQLDLALQYTYILFFLNLAPWLSLKRWWRMWSSNKQSQGHFSRSIPVQDIENSEEQ